MLVKNIYIRLGTSIFTASVAFITSILVVRTFGVKIYGNIAYYYSLAGVFSLFADLGISTAYNKFLASEDNPRDITTYIFLKFLLIVIYVLIFLAAYLSKFKGGQMDNKFLFIAFVVIVLDLTAQFFTATLIGKRDFAYLSRIEITSCMIMFIYNLIVCFVVADKYFLAANLAVFHSAMIVGGLVYFCNRQLLQFSKPRWTDIKKYLNYSAPISFSSIVSRFITYVDKLLVGKLIGITELGLYRIALQCYSAFDKLIKPVTKTLFTEIAHRITNVPLFFHKKFRDIVQILNITGGVMALTLIFLSTTVIILAFGVENIRSSLILKFFSLSILARLFWRPYNHVIYAIEKHKLILYLAPLNLIIRIVCYYFLIPLKIGEFYFGAIALPLTEFILWYFPAGILRVWILKKEYGNIHIVEIILKIWLPVAALIIIGYFFSYSIFTLAIALVSFLIIEYYFKVLTKERLTYLVEPFRAACSKL